MRIVIDRALRFPDIAVDNTESIERRGDSGIVFHGFPERELASEKIQRGLHLALFVDNVSQMAKRVGLASLIAKPFPNSQRCFVFFARCREIAVRITAVDPFSFAFQLLGRGALAISLRGRGRCTGLDLELALAGTVIQGPDNKAVVSRKQRKAFGGRCADGAVHARDRRACAVLDGYDPGDAFELTDAQAHHPIRRDIQHPCRFLRAR